MKRLSLLGFVGLLSSVLAGCPIFDDTHQGDGCRGAENCSSTTTPAPGCSAPSDCSTANETCGKDGQCHSGDCTTWGCTAGYDCVVDRDTKTASCLPNAESSSSSTGAGGSSSSSTGLGSTGSGGTSTGIYCGNPKDCAVGQNCAPDGTCHVGECAVTGCIYGYGCSATGTC